MARDKGRGFKSRHPHQSSMWEIYPPGDGMCDSWHAGKTARASGYARTAWIDTQTVVVEAARTDEQSKGIPFPVGLAHAVIKTARRTGAGKGEGGNMIPLYKKANGEEILID